ncbi:methyltransferase domain-containing protein [Actinomadura sp. KC06]|uniref:class I SAM-dependent methyltransferase n=1 Tax=Actinomadura sp. KC06 TaxID=2530369 RepID=UPI00105335C5|nr:class I SAM-dependent methyltransferase [Actinomadura sp. KC06]TDD35630.1 methyltransferase domain-containing protein [Actinomadura sp. KC06]
MGPGSGPSEAAPRGRLGTMTAMPGFDDESHLDFVEGLRRFTLAEINPVAAEAVRERVAERRPESLDDLRAAAESVPLVGLRNRLLRSTQDMNWARVTAAYERLRPALEAELDDAAGRGPGRLELANDWEHPAYSADVHFHRQPGGYHDEPLAGYVYHYGTKVFHLGTNDRDEAKIARAHAVPGPADGSVARVLDIACSIGAMTVAFKDRWPDAEVWGVDSAAPLLRYAHARAVRLGADVVFSQRLAEDLRFPDGSFDVAYLGTILHEVPWEIALRAVAEARRVLRPGGVLVVHEMRQPDAPPEPWATYDRDFDTRFNGEPFAFRFVHGGIGAELERLFSTVEFTNGRTATWVCTA